MKLRYVMLIEGGPGHLQGYFPDLPGCTTAGATKAELLVNAKEALQLYLEDFAQREAPFPVGSAAEDLAVVEIEDEDLRASWPHAKAR